MSVVPEPLRAQVAVRAGDRCEYCRISAVGQVGPFPIDHVVPRSDGGATEFDNLAFSCNRCNGAKWAFRTGLDPESGEETPLFNPRTQKWNDHFEWSATSPFEIVGKTAIGRATIARLQMNPEPDTCSPISGCAGWVASVALLAAAVGWPNQFLGGTLCTL